MVRSDDERLYTRTLVAISTGRSQQLGSLGLQLQLV